MINDQERRILEYLQSTNAAKTRQQVAQAVGLPSHLVVPLLVRLRDLHLIDKTGSAWRARTRAAPIAASSPITRSTRSGASDLGNGNLVRPQVTQTNVGASVRHDNNMMSGPRAVDASSRWSDFRSLCLYYAACVRVEERASVSAFANQEGAEFITLDGPLDWRSIGSGQHFQISGREEWESFFRRHRSKGSFHTFYLGTPVDVFVGTSKSKDEYRIISPVFVVSVIAALRDGFIDLQPTPLVEVNHGWVERRVPDARRRRQFLDEIGMSPTQFRSDDQDELWPVGGFKDAVRSLFNARKEWWKEFPDPENLSHEPTLQAIETSGLYNRAVLMCQPALKYTKRLVEELQQLAYAVADEDLDRTALSALFPHQPPKTSSPPTPPLKNPPSLAEFCLLNSFQREASHYGTTSPLTVVTGPPGTGKSMVVAHTMVNSAVQGRSCLFASRNHQAIEAVEPKINAMVEPETLVLRPTRPFGAHAAQFEWYQAMTSLLARPRRQGLHQEQDDARAHLAEILERRREGESLAEMVLVWEERLSKAEIVCQGLLKDCPVSWHDLAASRPQLPAKTVVEGLLKTSQLLTIRSIPWYLRPFGWLVRSVSLRRMRSRFASLTASLAGCVRDVVVGDCAAANNTPTTVTIACERLLAFARLTEGQGQRAVIESSLSSLPSRDSVQLSLRDLQRELEDGTKRLMRLLAESAGADISDDQREEFAQLRAAMKNRPQEIADATADSSVAKAFRKAMPELMQHFPLWSVSNLSVSKAIPLAPASFDLVIVDEASQCDVASVVPLLYRARRAMIVGDPNQLQHVTRLSRETDMRLRKQSGVADLAFERYTFVANSMYDFAASSKTRDSVALQNHYRCHPEIADFCNRSFYHGVLNVMTDADSLSARLGIPRKARACVWEHVPGDAIAASSGCYSPVQAERILLELQRLAARQFPGTVGVVTPFRAQAQRIRDLVHQNLSSDLLARWRFLVDTVDGFQGDERDLILFSLVASTDMPQGSAYFLKSTPNRFNVAASRARAMLRVYGDENWASGCGIPFISELLRRCREDYESTTKARRHDLIGPVWEPLFAVALRSAGLPFEQQYPACGCYLDFALFPEHGKINVEIDGETYHRSSGGERKIDDIYRDLVLEGAGWEVMRFWVYQIRENIDECINRVRDEYERCRRDGQSVDTTANTPSS